MTNGSEKYIEAIKYLNELYDFLNGQFWNGELEKPVITVQADTKNKATGWFVCGEVWKENGEEHGTPELNISAQFLNRPFEDVAETMLHEQVHNYAYMNKMQDCSRGGSYHNKLFKKLAEAHGLSVDNDKRIGWAVTKLTPATRETLALFAKEHTFIYRLPDCKGLKVKSSSTRKYACPICGISVRATKQIRVMCVDCETVMVEDD
ncbi:MAG: hypothetical protein DBX59_03555 [Bacillota bacterium]|nr:MAG: hypothetical protein DBX59_03555 [Bacillota bacterium]